MKVSRSSFLVGFVLTSLLLGSGLIVFMAVQQKESPKTALNPDRIERRHSDGLSSNATTETHADDSPTAFDLTEFTGDLAGTIALRKLLAIADEELTIELLNQSRAIRHDFARTAVQVEIFRKLAYLNPEEAYAYADDLPRLHRKRLITPVFREWAHHDLAAAIEFAKGLPAPFKAVAVEAMLSTRTDLPDDALLQIARELGRESIAVEWIETLALDTASIDPARAFNSLLNDSKSDYLQLDSFTAIATAWIESEGPEAISRIPETATDWRVRSRLLYQLLIQVAQTDPALAWQQAQEFYSEHNKDSLLSVLAYKWSTKDPSSALTAISEIEPETLRPRILDDVARGWAHEDPWDLVRNLSDFPKNMQTKAYEHAVIAIASVDPKRAAAMLDELDETSTNNVEFYVARGLAKQDPRNALDWVLSSTRVSHSRRHLLSSVWSELVKEDPQLAMQKALELPIESNEIGCEFDVIHDIAQMDIDLALTFLPQVREGRTEESVFDVLGEMLLNKHEHERALELGKQLPLSKRDDYYTSLIREWVDRDPVGLYELIDNLPSMRVRSKAAARLIVNAKSDKSLSPRNLDSLKPYATEDDMREALDERLTLEHVQMVIESTYLRFSSHLD